MNKWMTTICSMMCFLLAGISNAEMTVQANDEAVAAATQWLQKVDAKQLKQAYDSSGKLMREAVDVEKWSAAVEGVRQQAGEMQSRALNSVTAHESFPGLSNGDYMVVVFNTKFAHKPAAIETLSFQREDDGQYRVIGYFVQ
ncbi:DUF4019 domain-containing protein [Permianibacter aggregans]|uniref:Uncharacterized protein DUF4019 n=1 Tax=Permianibacter aggregans TaxID=1510150 RepID=A0A4R6UG56_9GAMM|nr:DUF4019 domain-containing protein [Permianibacter aggregans]QGX41189.1 DUF4019 domain-containing protein [Permianibacter aggregans]TDQ45790.1 uncharacterized protein DUF4019 [Permianibacter aggregans]